jgi:hypothetical protein
MRQRSRKRYGCSRHGCSIETSETMFPKSAKKTKSVSYGTHIVISERLSSVISTTTTILTTSLCRTSREAHEGICGEFAHLGQEALVVARCRRSQSRTSFLQEGGRSSSHSSRSSSSTRSASRKTNILPGRFCVVSGQTNSCGRSRGERVSGSLLFTV